MRPSPVFIVLLSIAPAFAGTHTWTGGAGGQFPQWSNPANWTEGAPTALETNVALVFPTNTAGLTTHDIAGLTVDTISLGRRGYTINGATPLTLTGGLTTLANGGTTFSQIASLGGGGLVLNLGATQTFALQDRFHLLANLALGANTLTVASATTDALFTNAISGTGALVITGTAGGTVELGGTVANSFTGGTTVSTGGHLRLAKTAAVTALPGPVNLTTGTLELGATQQLAAGAALTLGPGSQLVFAPTPPNSATEAIGALAADGVVNCSIDLGTNPTNELRVGTGAPGTVFSGVISGAGIFTKAGSANLVLNGNNTLTGATRVVDGGLQIDGRQPSSPVQISGQGTVRGSGTLGAVTVNDGGRLHPGGPVAPLLQTSNLTINAGGTLETAVGATTATTERLAVTGTVTVAGTLTLSGNAAGPPPIRLIDNDGTDAISGAFDGMPQAALVSVGSATFTLTYTGGDGNDLELVAAGSVTTTTTLSTTTTTVPLDCATQPRTDCKPAGASTLLIKRGTTPAKNLLSWRWTKGAAVAPTDFGDPTATADQVVCVYDATDTVVGSTVAPAGGTCGAKPCWKSLGGKGFLYKNARKTPAGIAQLTLKAGGQGKSRVTLLGAGANLPAPALPLASPVTVQLQSAGAGCVTSRISSAKKNSSKVFRGSGQ
jgi:autotransporter-associated beta strand protein